MTNADIQAILNQHDAVFRALREASAAFDHAVDGNARPLTAIHDANHQQGLAIVAALAANQAALRLLSKEE